ncbi:hypothetical protein ES705_11545 [subsurface metagenome]
MGKGSFFLFFSGGLILTVQLAANSQVNKYILLIIVLLLTALAISMLSLQKLNRHAICILALVLGMAGGLSRLNILTGSSNHGWTGIPLSSVASFTGRLIEDSRESANGLVFYNIKLSWCSTAGNTSTARANGRAVVMVKEGRELFWGERIKVSGVLKALSSEKANISRENFISWATPQDIEVPGSGSFSGLLHRRGRLLQYLNRNIEELLFPSSALLRALLLGQRQELSLKLMSRFRKSGSLHVLALSGLHVGIIYILLYYLFIFLPGRSYRIIAASIIVSAYLFLVGPRPSLTRAVIMLCAGGMAYLADRDFNPLNILSLAAAVILLIEPLSLFELSFQLSFLSLLGIILIGGPLAGSGAAYLPGFIRFPLAYSVGAQLMTAPVLLYTFGSVYPIGIPAALLLIPLISLFIWFGIIYLMISWIPVYFVGRIFALFLHYIYLIISGLTALLSQAPAVTGSGHIFLWLSLPAVVLLIRRFFKIEL